MDRAHHLGQPMNIAPAAPTDSADWASLRHALWPDSSSAEHAEEIAGILAAPGTSISLVARTDAGMAIGFAEASIRHDYVNGCDSSPVGFLEGIYVAPEHRRHGVAAALVAAATEWVRSQGCTELASDAPIDNTTSHQMHNALGFEETQRVVYFRKRLTP
jgi:aminoglycoside 6'-N-acetyltransferase I